MVDRGHRCDGMVGIVREITNDTMRVDLDADVYRRFFLADFSRRAFRSDQLKLVGGGAQQPASQQFREIGAELFQSVRRDVLDVKRKQPFRQYWQGLSRGAKIGWALAVGAAALVLMSIAGNNSNPNIGGGGAGDTQPPGQSISRVDSPRCLRHDLKSGAAYMRLSNGTVLEPGVPAMRINTTWPVP